MTIKQAREVCEILNDGWTDATVHEEYSGRGMHGKTCVGISYDGSGVLLGAACMEVGIDYNNLPTNTDSMGLGKIYY